MLSATHRFVARHAGPCVRIRNIDIRGSGFPFRCYGHGRSFYGRASLHHIGLGHGAF